MFCLPEAAVAAVADIIRVIKLTMAAEAAALDLLRFGK